MSTLSGSARPLTPAGVITRSATLDGGARPDHSASTTMLSASSIASRPARPRTRTVTLSSVAAQPAATRLGSRTGTAVKVRSCSGSTSTRTVTWVGCSRTAGPRPAVSRETVCSTGPSAPATSSASVDSESIRPIRSAGPSRRTAPGTTVTRPAVKPASPVSRTTGCTGTVRRPVGSSATVNARGCTSCTRAVMPRGSSTSPGNRSTCTSSPSTLSGRTRVSRIGAALSLSSSRRGTTTSARTAPGGWSRVRPAGAWTVRSTGISVFTGSSPAARSQRNRESAREVILSGRSAVSAERRLTLRPRFLEQAVHQGAVGGRVPVVGSDHPLDQDSAPIEEKTLRHAGSLIKLGNPIASVVQDVEAETQIVGEGLDVLGRALVDAHRRDGEPLGSSLEIELLHGGHFDLARYAPGGPDVHQGHLAGIVLVQGHRVARGQIHDPEIGGPPADFDRRGVGPELGDGEGAHAEAEQHHQDHEPLPGHQGQASTAQRRRSSRTARAGSAAPNTAVPATKVSAPAPHASAMVSAVIPPSTSSAAREPARSSTARTRRILSVLAARYDWPPYPGLTDITSTRSRSSTTSSR